MEQLSLFDNQNLSVPLASRMRPDSLDEFTGQKHLVGPGCILRQLIEKDQLSSMIFWGPPGVGKTTLARIIAARTRADARSIFSEAAPAAGGQELLLASVDASDGRVYGE